MRWHPVVTDCESWCTDVMEISLAGAWTWARAWKVPQEWLCTSQGSSKKVIGLCNHWCSPAFTNHLFTFTTMPTFLECKKQLRSLFFPLLQGIVTKGWRQIPSVLGSRREKASVHPYAGDTRGWIYGKATSSCLRARGGGRLQVQRTVKVYLEGKWGKKYLFAGTSLGPGCKGHRENFLLFSWEQRFNRSCPLI